MNSIKLTIDLANRIVHHPNLPILYIAIWKLGSLNFMYQHLQEAGVKSHNLQLELVRIHSEIKPSDLNANDGTISSADIRQAVYAAACSISAFTSSRIGAISLAIMEMQLIQKLINKLKFKDETQARKRDTIVSEFNKLFPDLTKMRNLFAHVDERVENFASTTGEFSFIEFDGRHVTGNCPTNGIIRVEISSGSIDAIEGLVTMAIDLFEKQEGYDDAMENFDRFRGAA